MNQSQKEDHGKFGNHHSSTDNKSLLCTSKVYLAVDGRLVLFSHWKRCTSGGPGGKITRITPITRITQALEKNITNVALYQQ